MLKKFQIVKHKFYNFLNSQNYLLANHFNIPEHILLPDDQGNRKEGITHEHIINKFKELDASGHHLKEVGFCFYQVFCFKMILLFYPLLKKLDHKQNDDDD